MKLYRHYKNKPYLVLGNAKHSETLEDFVVYRTLYDNPTASLWIRPKQMFEENIVIDGKSVERFAKVQLVIEDFHQFTSREEAIIASLMKEIFGEWDSKWFHGGLKNHTKIYLLVAYIDETPVGFKLGYELDSQTFYSWLGGVLPAYRNLGVAADLMTKQHEWCKSNGYKKIQTKTQNRWKNMLILNLEFGFSVIGYHSSDEGGPKIMLEKIL